MAFSRSGSPDEDGTAVFRDEVAVEQPQDGLLGDLLGEGKIVLFEELPLGQAGVGNGRRNAVILGRADAVTLMSAL